MKYVILKRVGEPGSNLWKIMEYTDNQKMASFYCDIPGYRSYIVNDMELDSIIDMLESFGFEILK